MEIFVDTSTILALLFGEYDRVKDIIMNIEVVT